MPLTLLLLLLLLLLLRRSFRIKLPPKCRSALLDHGLEFVIVNVGKCEIEAVACGGSEGGEETVEEDCVENGFDEGHDRAGICKEVENELCWRLGIHGGLRVVYGTDGRRGRVRV